MTKEKRKLNRTIPFARVYGEDKAVYEQYGILFNGIGDELPGYEDVEIPEEVVKVVVDDAKAQELVKENSALKKQLGEFKGGFDQAVADKEAAESDLAEVQGKLDTAEVEIKQLQDRIASLQSDAGNDAKSDEKPKPSRSGKKNATSDVDQQLDLQGKS